MKKYLSLIRRGDFHDFFNSGFFYLDKGNIVEYECEFQALQYRRDIYDALFARANTIDSLFSYLMINYEKEDETGDYSFVSIEEVKNIFALSEEGVREFEENFDPHIRIERPIWKDAVTILRKKGLFNNSMQGIRNIFSIFKLEGINWCKSIISEDEIKSMLSDVYDNVKPSGDKSLWEYLMRYERHSFYPKNTLGYYMDIVHVVCNFLAKKEVPSEQVEQTKIFGVLQELMGKNMTSDKINEYLIANDQSKSFLTKISQIVPNANFINTAVSFLKFKDLYQEELKYDDSVFIERCKCAFGDSFTLACYMLGVVLGHKKTYACMYENLPLAFYKSKEEVERIEKMKEYKRLEAEEEMRRMEEEREREKESGRGGRSINRNGKNGKKSYKSGKKWYSQEFSWDESEKIEETSYKIPSNDKGDNEFHKEKNLFYPPKDSENEGILKDNVHDEEDKVLSSPLDNKDISSTENNTSTSIVNEQTDETKQVPSLSDDKKTTDNVELKSIKFPVTFKKLTPKGKFSTAKDSTKVINDFKEYQKFINSIKANEWKQID